MVSYDVATTALTVDMLTLKTCDKVVEPSSEIIARHVQLDPIKPSPEIIARHVNLTQ